MNRFDNNVEAVKSRLDLVEIVNRYVELKPVGTRLMGVCPFHQESKPSFTVDPSQGFYYCFGCQASGDVIDFYCRINGLQFIEGLQELAREAGIELNTTVSSSYANKNRELRQICFDINSLAQTFFQQGLKSKKGRVAWNYLQQRGFSEEIVQRFGLGWSPASWEDLKTYLIKRNFSPEQGVQAGLLSKNQQGKIYDRFRSRVIFPIYDLAGKVVAFGGRVIGEGEPKYLNSSESPIFKKGDLLYGLYQARTYITQTKEVFLTEGYIDVITLVQFGFHNACGVLGTALTLKQVQRLAGLCKRVSLVFDGDQAGQTAAFRSAEMLLQFGLEVKVITLPEGEDIDDTLRKKGVNTFQTFFKNADSGLVFCLKMIKFNNSPKDIISWAKRFLRNLQDISLQAYYIPRLVKELNLSESELRQALKEEKQKEIKDDGSFIRSLYSSAPAQRDRELLRFAICHPEYLTHLNELGLRQALKTERGRLFWDKLCSVGYENIISHLDEKEKRFFIQSQLEDYEIVTDYETIWQDLKRFLQEVQRKKEQKEILAALERAQKLGDSAKMAKYLKKYRDFLREGE